MNCWNYNQNTPPKQYVSLKEIESDMVPPTTKVDHISRLHDDSMTFSRVDGALTEMNYFLTSDQIQSQIHVNENKFFKSNKKNYQTENEPINLKFLCDYPGCMKHFKDNHHLKVHQRRHTGEKPFTCDYCQRRFSQKNNLKTHQRIHNNEKPYECKFCHQKFRQPTNLNAHIKKSHEPFLMW